MGTFTTALGETYTVERRLPRMGWRPRWRGVGDPTDAAFLDFGDSDGLLAVIGLAIAFVLLIVVVVPLLLFVAEVAALLAIVIPVMVLAIAAGVVRHTVQLRAGGKDGTVIDRREVRGVLSSWRASRELRGEAESGRFRQVAAARPGSPSTGAALPGAGTPNTMPSSSEPPRRHGSVPPPGLG